MAPENPDIQMAESLDRGMHGRLSVAVVVTAVLGVLALVWAILKLGGGSGATERLSDEGILSNFVLLPSSGTWLGVHVRPAEELPKGERALQVTRVMLGSPAYQAGIQVGDIVERVGNSRIQRPDQLRTIIGDKSFGDTVRITINRFGTKRALFVKLGTLPVGKLAAATGPAGEGWLGVDIQPIDDLLAKRLGLPDKRGVVVSYVHPGSPARASGLHQGDVIRGVGESRIQKVDQLVNTLGASRPGDTLRLTVWQRGALKDVKVLLAERPPPGKISRPMLPEAAVEIEAAWLGLDIVPLTPAEAEELGLPAGLQGMVVDAVATGAGLDAGLQVGDVIVAVNGKSTATVADFKEATERAVGAVIDVVRNGRHLYVSVPPPGAVGGKGSLRQVVF